MIPTPARFARTPLAQAIQRSMAERKIATLKTLAKKIGVGYRSLHGVVTGASLPNARTQSKYQKFLDLSASTYQKIIHESQPTAQLEKSDATDSAVQTLQQTLFKQFLGDIPLSVYYSLQELSPQDYVALEHWLKLPPASRVRVTAKGRATAEASEPPKPTRATAKPTSTGKRSTAKAGQRSTDAGKRTTVKRKSAAIKRTTGRRGVLPAGTREDQAETEADRLERSRRVTSFGIGKALLARITPQAAPSGPSEGSSSAVGTGNGLPEGSETAS